MAKDNNPLLKRFGEHLKELRQKRGLSQTVLANVINKDQQSLQRLEAGKINPGLIYLIELAKGLDIPLKDLFDFELLKENSK